MKKILKFFTSKIKVILLLYVLIQLILVFSIHPDYKSDSLYYYSLAQECIELNEFYPADRHLYEDYLTAPLYINILIIILHIYNSTVSISLFSMVIVLLQLFLLYKITKATFSKNTALLLIIFSVFYLNTIGMILQNFTELTFLFFSTASIYFYLRNKNHFFILSGISVGCAIAVRPLGWALLIAFAAVHLYNIIKLKKLLITQTFIYLGTLVFIILFGMFINSYFGKFEFTSTTGPVNILIGANDDATGAFNSTVLEKGNTGYIQYSDSLTYIQKGEFYYDKATKWIVENPIKWLSLAPLKFLHAYGWDDISLTSLLGYNDTNFLRVLRILITEKNFDKALPNTTTVEKIFFFLILAIFHLYYYILLIAIILGINQFLKHQMNTNFSYLVLFFVLFATVMIMITVGTPRYKYPMFILLLPFAANYIDTKLKPEENKIGKS